MSGLGARVASSPIAVSLATMARLLIVHHSPTPTVRALTDAVVAGAHDDEIARWVRAGGPGAADLPGTLTPLLTTPGVLGEQVL